MEKSKLEIGKVYYFDKTQQSYGEYLGVDKEGYYEFHMFKPLRNPNYFTYRGNVEFNKEDICDLVEKNHDN